MCENDVQIILNYELKRVSKLRGWDLSSRDLDLVARSWLEYLDLIGFYEQEVSSISDSIQNLLFDYDTRVLDGGAVAIYDWTSDTSDLPVGDLENVENLINYNRYYDKDERASFCIFKF